MENQPNSRMCFVCGMDNPIGLHLHFYTEDESYPGQPHGGIISTLLDIPTQMPVHSQRCT